MESDTDYFFVLTLQWQEPDMDMVHATVTGIIKTRAGSTQKGLYEHVLQQALELAKEKSAISEISVFSVLFYYTAPNQIR